MNYSVCSRAGNPATGTISADFFFYCAFFGGLPVFLVSGLTAAILRREATAGGLALGAPRRVIIGGPAEAGAIVLERGDIRGGFSEELAGIHRVVLQLRGEALAIVVDSRAHAAAILEEAGVDATQRLLTLQVSSEGSVGGRAVIACPWLGASVLCVGSIVWVVLAPALDSLSVTFLMLPWLHFIVTGRALLDRPLVIGRDGIRFGGKYFPHRGLVTRVDGAMVLLELDGRIHRIRTSGAAEAMVIAQRIAAARPDACEATARDLIARNGRTLSEWRAHLRSLGRHADYRAVTVGPAALATATATTAHPSVRRALEGALAPATRR